MRILYLYMCLSFLGDLHAQDSTVFAPPGSTFYYTEWGSGAPYPGLLTFVSDGEIVLHDTTARILNFYATEGEVLVPLQELNKYVFTSGNKVYYWVQDAFYLLFDFGAQPGDTIHSRAEDFPISLICFADFSNGPLDFSYVIDSIGSMTIDGQNLRLQYVTPIYNPSLGEDWLITNPIIERIGQITPASYWWGQGEGCFLGGFAGKLRCYEDNDIYFKNTFTFYDLACDYVAAVEPLSPNIKSLFPNPTNDFINLDSEAESIIIYTIDGLKIVSHKNQNRIDVSTLPPNIYIIQFQIKSKNYIRKFLKL